MTENKSLVQQPHEQLSCRQDEKKQLLKVKVQVLEHTAKYKKTKRTTPPKFL